MKKFGMLSVLTSVVALAAFGVPASAETATYQRAVPDSVENVLAVLVPGAFVTNDIDSAVQAMRDRQTVLLESSQALMNRAEGESRDLTAEEQREIDGLADEFDDLDRQVTLRERVNAQNAALTAPRGRQTEADPIEGDAGQENQRPANQGQRAQGDSGRGRVPAEPRATARGTAGFRHFGEFANSVRRAVINQSERDPRLMNAAATTYGNESVGADGGYAVPPDFRAEIMSKVFGEDSLISRTDQNRTGSNSLSMPIDMTTPWQTSGGIQAYWAGEAAAIQQSKPALEELTVKLHGLNVLIPMTEEQLEDAPFMDTYLRRKAPEKMDFKISDAIVRGTGAGMPLGFLNSPALVTQAAEAAQSADTIVSANISKMWSRMPASSRRTAVWLIHPDAEPQLDGLVIGTTPVYVGPGGLSDSPYGRLKGRPVIPHQVAETVGDLGDLMLVDLAQYLSATKSGGGRDANGMKSDVSMHLWFDQNLTAFKFNFRLAGQPWWSTPTQPRDGANTQSPFVVLAAR